MAEQTARLWHLFLGRDEQTLALPDSNSKTVCTDMNNNDFQHPT